MGQSPDQLKTRMVHLRHFFFAFWILTVRAGTVVFKNGESFNETIVAYDCESENIKVAVVSAVHVSECVAKDATLRKLELSSVQILRKRNPVTVHVYRCQIFKNISSLFCQGNEYNYTNRRLEISRPHQLSALQCQDLHRTLTINIDGINIKTLPNTTTHATANIAGWFISNLCICDDNAFTYDGVSYPSSTVLIGDYQVTLSDMWVTVPVDSTTISHPVGLKCPMRDGSCIDPEIGTLTWEQPRPSQTCHEDEFDVLYRGPGSMVMASNDDFILRVLNKDLMIHILLGPRVPFCDTETYSTKYAGLFVMTSKASMFKKLPISSASVNLLRFTDSKIAGLESYREQTLSVAYNTFMFESCLVERERLIDRLSLVYNSPRQAHLLTNRRRGVHATVAGEVLYLTLCELVTVELRTQNTCSQEVPVLYLGKKMFMDAMTRILTSLSNPVPCSRLAPVTFRIGKEWIKMTPEYEYADEPTRLSPWNTSTHRFKSFKSTAEGGLYNESDIQALLSFLTSQTRIQNKSGAQTGPKYNATEASHEWINIALQHINAAWEVCVVIGQVYIILIVMKTIINIIVRTYSIYKLTGLSWKLLTGLCSGATMWLMMTWFQPEQKTSKDVEESSKLTNEEQEVITCQQCVNTSTSPLPKDTLHYIHPIYLPDYVSVMNASAPTTCS